MKIRSTISLSSLLMAMSFVIICGCEKETFRNIQKPETNNHRLDLGYDALIKDADVNITINSRSHGYIAVARGRGIIPSGEYAGQRFQIHLEAVYSDIGAETLVSGSAVITIRGERFESIVDTIQQSFCCGEGYLEFVDGEYTFIMYGQVSHDTSNPHNHLFAGLATTAGTMNMNIADQTGTIVEPSTPPHDPGIGLIENFDAQFVRVDLH